MVAAVPTDLHNPPFLQSLERSLGVFHAFSADTPAMTLSEVARVAGITRASARRILLTLEHLGYVSSDGRLFSLTPRVLSIGWAYLSSLNLAQLAEPLMQELTLPAHATSMGRVLLAGLAPEELEAYLAAGTLEGYTERTTTDPHRLRAVLECVRADGWSLVDQELELGLRSIAAPIHGRDGRTLAALTLSAAAARLSVEELRERPLPLLLETAAAISRAVARQGEDPAGPHEFHPIQRSQA